jgi:tRNA pseudouridine38-40 synthase
MILEYDGTDFVGWQVQLNGRSVQGEIEGALMQILQEKVNIIGAGRTDAGVHARGQVASCRFSSSRSLDEVRRGLDGLLPEDIVVKSVEEVPLEFHARYDAKERRYRYFISKEKHALCRRYAWYIPYSLNIAEMQRAVSLVEGKHNFEAFSKTDSGTENYVCTVRSASWFEEDDRLIFEIRADRYVRGMVRGLVGTMVDVGRGYTTVYEFERILMSRSRLEAGMAAPAKGLFLEEVTY